MTDVALTSNERTKHQMMQRLRGERRDGYPADVTMLWAAEEIERLRKLMDGRTFVTDAHEPNRGSKGAGETMPVDGFTNESAAMKFRKKPVEIEAYQIPPDDEQTRLAPPVWLLDAIVKGIVIAVPGGGLDIPTREGTMRGNVGDWVIQGVKGELYPCEPDIFVDSYDPCGG